LKSLLKRSFDVLLALTLLFLIMSWLVPVLWVLNLFVGEAPLFFSYHREGKHRKLFWCYKFRTFPIDAVHPKPGELMTTPIPWLGTLLRNSGIDELPQALNILKGEMSVVGPRPHLPAYNAHYQNLVGQEQMDQRHHVRPGLTGLAQIRGYRGETVDPASIHNRINSDLEYIKRQSLLLDLEIIGVSFWLMIRAAVRQIFN
jgi:putative colanic acid biosynthesis UDP-glucose lipid carrier transferase